MEFAFAERGAVPKELPEFGFVSPEFTRILSRLVSPEIAVQDRRAACWLLQRQAEYGPIVEELALFDLGQKFWAHVLNRALSGSLLHPQRRNSG